MPCRKKSFALLLICVMLFSILISCGGNSAGTDSVTGAISSSAETGAKTDPFAALPSENYGGYAFTVLSVPDTNYQIYAEEMTGEIFNDAMFQRQSALADLYNVTFDSYEAPSIDKISTLLGASRPCERRRL